ncbi:major facilitator superfamily domain-containing protein [Fennellomyces sp. T-0311]|nr:major facilitator superfamily domain-containing protein [Fennellomyces sp. T-0311]
MKLAIPSILKKKHTTEPPILPVTVPSTVTISTAGADGSHRPYLSVVSSATSSITKPEKRSIWARITDIVKSRMAFRPPVPHDPRKFSKSRKRWILACLALGSSLNGFCSTIYFPGIPDITNEFGASDIEVTLTNSLFMLFGGIGPIMWASMSDYYYVRRFFYLISLLIFTAASVGCALSLNVYMLIILRCIQSVGTSVTISVGAGTVSDCWSITERGTAFSILFVGQFLGPLVGPMIGGGLTTALGWRASFWFCSGYGVFLFCFLFTFLPETYRREQRYSEKSVPAAIDSNTTITPEDVETSTIATIDSQSAPETSPKQQKRMNPFRSIFLLRHLFVFLIALGTGIIFGTMFTIETIIPNLYETTYGFESWQTGLSYLGAGIGNLLGSIVSGRVSDYLLKRARQKRGGAAKTEDRLTLNAWPGGYVLVPLGVLVFGWSLSTQLTVWVSIVGFGVVCFGMSQVYAAGSAYLVDAMPGQGASATAASNVMRMSMACVLSLIAEPVVDAIGPGYLSVVLAGINVFGISLFLLVKLKGQTMRERAGYGSNQEE